MGYKLHRSQRTVFRRRRPVLRMLLSLLAAAAVVAGGFFIARWMDRPSEEYPADTSVVTSTPTNTDTPPKEPSPTQPTTTNIVNGFWLPHDALLNADRLADTIEAAANAGINTLLFDLKDSDGTLYYLFDSQQAAQVDAFAADALTKDQLQSVMDTANAAGLQVIPRMYAFRDNAAARALAGARITHESDPSWVWYDADPSKGGKAWLNPYADEAHLYLINLAKELKGFGVAGILLDGVQFPTNAYSASFGSSANTSMDYSEILTTFIDNMQEALGNDCPVLLASTGEAALGVNTDVYGGNPLTFDANQAVPHIDLAAMPSSVTIGESVITISPKKPADSMEALIHHMALRLKVAGNTTTVTPWLETDSLSTDDLMAYLNGSIAGGTEAFILYNTDGKYDFAALT